LSSAVAKFSSPQQDFNWLLLADVSSAKARKGENNAGLFDQTWAEVATAIYDRLTEAAQQKKTKPV
jgi:hypothetical protein